MLKVYNTFQIITCENGILIISLTSTDHPFIIMNNSLFGFVVFHAGEENYSIRDQIKNSNSLDFTKMITYHATVEDRSRWVISIPYENKIIDPHSLYKFSSLDIHKCFSEKDFPSNFYQYNNLAVATGFCE